MRRQVNVKFVAVMLLTLGVLAGAGHFLHGYQVKRNARGFLRLADQAEADKNISKTIEYLGRYLGFYPKDNETKARYALLLADQAKTGKARLHAFLVLDEVLRQDPEREDIRRRTIKAAMEVERFADARDHLEILLKALPDDPELEELHGRCDEAGSQFAKAAEWYEKAVQHDPQRIDSYARLAHLYQRRLDRSKDAEALMERLVKLNPESVRVRLARANFLRDLGLFDAAQEEIGYAREHLASDEADVLLVSSDLALQGKKPNLEEARRHLEHGLKQHPEDPRFYFGLASLELRTGHREQAVKRLREALKVLPDRTETLWTAADLFLDAGEPKEARNLLPRMSGEETAVAVNYLRGRLLLAEEKVAAARTLLEKVRPQLARSPQMTQQTDLFLGQCYERLGNPEQQLAAYKRATAGESPTPAARFGLAAALAANGQIDEAILEYRTLMEKFPEMRLAAVRLMVRRNLARPVERQNWDEIEQLLRAAPTQVQNTVEYQLLAVDLLLARGKSDEAAVLLGDCCEQMPKEVRFWLGLAALADREEARSKDPSPQPPPRSGEGEVGVPPLGGLPAPQPPKGGTPTLPEAGRGFAFARSFQVLDEAERVLGDTVELRLTRASRLVRLPAEEARPLLKKLEENTRDFSKADQTRLLQGLAEASSRLGDREAARRLLALVAEREPQQLFVRERLFDLAILAEDMPTIEAAQEELRKIEGEEGSLWRYGEAARLVLQARKGDKSGLAQARKRLSEVAKIRPTWSRVPVLRAEIDELEGNVDAALENYQRSVEMGEQNPAVIQRAVRLLTSRNHIDEAKKLLDHLQERSTISGDLGRLATQVSLLNQDSREHTLKLAEGAVSKDSRDYRDHLFRGQVFWSVGTEQKEKGEAEIARKVLKDAEDAFRQAIALNDKVPETWTALVVFLAGTEQKQGAEAETENARKALPADKAPQALAVCYEALGQRDKAEQQHVARLKSKPTDLGVLREVASYFLRGGESRKAEPLLRQMIGASNQGEEGPRWARRSLAIILASSGDYQQSRQALAMMEENLQEGRETPEDQRVRALVLAMRPGGRQELIKTLEYSYARQRPTPGEQLLLAQLYEANRDWSKANEHLLALLSSKGGDAPVYLAYYVRALLRQDKVAEATVWLGRLKKKEPDSAATVELTARVLVKQGEGARGARLVQDYVRKELAAKKEAAILATGAALLEELKQIAAAEELYRQYVTETREKRPESVLLLAGFLGRQKRLSEALDLCEGTWQKCKPEEVATVSLYALNDGKPSEQDFERVAGRLELAMKKHPDQHILPMALANMRVLQDRVPDAEAIFRTMLKRDPNRVLAMNNLAWLLAMHNGQTKEGLDMISRAIDVGGPGATLLDTRGMIHLVRGQTDQAIKDLEQAVTERPKATFYFHLVQAYRQAKNQHAAERAWQKVRELKLSERDLFRVEIEEYRKLAAEFDEPKKSG